LESIASDPAIEVIPVTEDLYVRAFDLYRQRLDKDWGLTDCISFVVMADQQLLDALTTDEHFRQAGFRPLLRDPSF
jgi:predicted nucleic acid-binding protein